MPIRDGNIELLRQEMYIPVWQFAGWQPAILAADPSILTTMGVGAGNAATDVGYDEVTGMNYGGADLNAGDTISHVMRFPTFWNVEEPIGVRCIWTNIEDPATAADDVQFICLYNLAAFGAPLVAPATALNTVIPSQTYGSVVALWAKTSGRGIINANTFTQANRRGMFGFSIEADVVDIAANSMFLLGVTFDYIPNLTVSPTVNATWFSDQAAA